MATAFPEVPVSQLRASVDPAMFPFASTADMEPTERSVVGQHRGIDAIQFGMGMKENGYNIFVCGPPKAGLSFIARTYLEAQAKTEPVPPDWCYVYNFKEPDKPMGLQLTAGRGKELKKGMESFLEALQSRIPEIFDSDDYRGKENEVQQAFEAKRREIIDELSKLAKEEGFILQFSQVGMVIIPATAEGQPMGQEELSQLSDEEKKALRAKSDELQGKMKDAIKEIRKAEEAFKEKHSKLDNEIAMFVVEQLIEHYLDDFTEEEEVQEYLQGVQEDILENIDDFKKKSEGGAQVGPFPMPPREAAFKKYEVNVLIDNSETEGAPVVIESNPAYPNLFGTIERQAWFGALFTDFTMIKPGSLHKANGGYLVIKALDLLKWYLSWEALKRALRDEEIKIEDLGELYGMFSTRTIRPEPIPLDVKLVLTGDPWIYQLLYMYDDRFQKLFKVKAHLDDSMNRDADTMIECARMIGGFCTDQELRHLDPTGLARVLEYSMELTEDRDKLSLELGNISDLIKEGNYFAELAGADLVGREHIEKAIEKRIYRSNLIEERLRELTEKDIFWIETKGAKVGQVNGLSVLMTGDHEFGKPSRITAVATVGREGVVAIDRESKLSGNIHTKGLMILGSFLKQRFAHNKPISLSASICFEQSYGMVDGDSASSTELYALLSAISGVPLKQGIAVTGSVSQMGEIQPVGGVTKKIEAFFDICRHKGLTGDQGVVIPEKNVPNLMLKQEVVEAVRDGQFHVWPITTIEQGIEILTGVAAGELQPDGTYPEGTLFRKVDDRLLQIADIVKQFGKDQNGDGKGSSHDEGNGGCPSCGR